MINEGAIYTRGSSFKARTEASARKYRAEFLKLADYDKYGHKLSEADAENGCNFLPSLRSEIHESVKKRALQGKGIDYRRTSGNMLSSQAMCFNLFTPLSLHNDLATELFNSLIGDVIAVEDISIEYTPSNTIFGDQSGMCGVDCDVLLRYTNTDGSKALMVIETKYVESEFSTCGFRKSGHRNPCPSDSLVSDDLSNCRYKSLKKYRYWDVAEESGLFRMDLIKEHQCPFGGSLWQLWTNMALAYGIAKDQGITDYRYAVIYPEENRALSRKGKVFDDFRSYLIQPDRFCLIPLNQIISNLDYIAPHDKTGDWAREFGERYTL